MGLHVSASPLDQADMSSLTALHHLAKWVEIWHITRSQPTPRGKEWSTSNEKRGKYNMARHKEDPVIMQALLPLLWPYFA